MDPSDVSVTDFTIEIEIDDYVDLFAFDIELTWDDTLITFVSAAYTTQLDALFGAGQWAVVNEASTSGSYELAVTRVISPAVGVSGTTPAVLFTITLHVAKSCNFELQTVIQFVRVDLSDSTTPVPNPIPATVTDGLYTISRTPPDLHFVIGAGSSLPPYEYCDYIYIEVWATSISDCLLKDYDLTVQFDTEWLAFRDIIWGLDLGDNLTGQAGYDPVVGNTVHVYDTGGATFSNGDVLLFTIKFHVEFSDTPGHFWRTCEPHSFDIDFVFIDVASELSFEEGTVLFADIIVDPPLTITIDLIRGDIDLVNTPGTVELDDITDAAFYFGQTPPEDKYDLDCDGDIDIYDIVMIASNYGYNVP
jgi:hypothetical protein